MDESSAEITTTFLDLYTERGVCNRAHDGSSFVWNQNNWGISIEVSFVERKKDEATLSKQAKILDIPVVDGIYYWVQKNDESYRVQATEENRQLLRQQLSNQEIRKVLVKVDIPVADEDTIDKLLDQLDRGFERLSPYYQVTRD